MEIDLSMLNDLEKPNLDVLEDIPAPVPTQSNEDSAMSSLLGMSLEGKVQEEEGQTLDLFKIVETGENIKQGDQSTIDNLVQRDRQLDLQTHTEAVRQELDNALLHGTADAKALTAKVKSIDEMRSTIDTPGNTKEIKARAVQLAETNPQMSQQILRDSDIMESQQKLMEAIASGDETEIQVWKHQIKFDTASPEAKAQMEAIGIPWYEPADLLADMLTLGVASGIRTSFKMGSKALSSALVKSDAKMMAKALGVPVTHELVGIGKKLATTKFADEFLISVSKWAPRGFVRGTTRDVGWGMFAGGVMNVADMAYSDTTVTMLSGIIGPAATGALFGMTRKGLAVWLGKMADGNYKQWKAVKEVIDSQDTPLASVLKDAQKNKDVNLSDEIEFGFTHFTGLMKAAREAGSEEMQKELTNALRIASVSTPNSPLAKTVTDATQTDVLTPIIPLLKSGDDVKIGIDSKFARAFNNAMEWNKALKDRAFWDQAMENATNDPILQNMAAMRIYNGDQVGLGYTPTWGNGKKAAEEVGSTGFLQKMVGSSSSIMKRMSEALVKDPTYLLHKTNMVRKATNKAIMKIQKSLSRGERKQLNTFIDDINQTGVSPIMTEGGFVIGKHFYPMTEKTIEAYAKTRTAMDFLHGQINQSVMAQYKRNGFKFFIPAGSSVKIVSKTRSIGVIDDLGREMTEEAYRTGSRMFESTDEAARKVKQILNPDEQAAHLRDFKPTDNIIKYRQHYIPQIYKDDWRVWEVRKTEKGLKIAPKATAPTFSKANSALKNLTDAANDKTEYIVLRANENLSATDFLSTKKFSSELQTLNPNQIDMLKKTFLEAGADQRTIDTVFDGISKFSFKESSHLMTRKGRLKDWTLQNVAPLKTGLESIAEYVDTQSKYVAFADHLSAIKSKFLEDFGPYLDNDLDVFSGVKAIEASKNPKLADGIRLAQNQMRELFGIRTTKELERQSRLMQKAKDLYLKGGKWNTTLGKSTEALTKFTDLHRLFKTVGAEAKLGMFNISQLLVQSLAVLNPVGRHLFKDGASIFSSKNAGVLGMRDVGQMIVGMTEEGKYYKQLYARSGFGMMDYSNICDISNAYAGMRRLSSKAISASRLAYNIGEGTQKAVAWFAERRNLLNEITSGKNTTLSMKDVDSEKFLREVSKRAMDLSLNMSKFNQPMFAKGWAGVPFQFAQFATHQSELMFGKKLSKAERLGLWSSWIAVFGVGGGVPFLGDAVHFMETAVAESNPDFVGKPEEYGKDMARWIAKQAGSKDIEFWANLASKGAGYALTDGELDIASRAGVAHMLQNYYDGLSWDDLIGPSGQVILQVGKGGIENISDLINVMNGNAKFHHGIMMQPFKEVSGPTNIARAINAGMSGKLRDKNNRLIKEEPTVWEIVATGIGVTPGNIVKQQEELYKNIKFQQIMKEQIKEKAKKVAEVRVNDPKFSSKLLLDYVSQFAEVNPMSVRDFFMALSRELIATTVELDTRVNISSLRLLNRFSEDKRIYIENDNEMGNIFPDRPRPSFELPTVSKGAISKHYEGNQTLEMIKQHEGSNIVNGKHMPYDDGRGNITVGYGHKVLKSEIRKYENGISEKEALALLKSDFVKHRKAATSFPNFNSLSDKQKNVIVDMTFNMGANWWNSWPDLKEAALNKDWDTVETEMRDSAWYNQVGIRATDLIKMWRNNG